MGADTATLFNCAACDAELPVAAVQYDDLGYPECPECSARTGPLASVEAEEPTGGVVN